VAKGSSFEREICRALSDWWVGGVAEDVLFWRTAMSGGRATVRRKKGKTTTKSHCGDIGALTEEGKPLTDLITFELKRAYRSASLNDLLDRSEKSAIQTYENWISQARRSAAEAGTPFWAVIHKRDRRDITITIPLVMAQKLLATRASPVWPSVAYHVRVRDAGAGTESDLRLFSITLYGFFQAFGKKDIIRVLAAWLSKKSSSRTASPTSGPSLNSTPTSRRSSGRTT